jgi:threonylcarbamoyladenosine tRNA methylthiotransferase MtaB
VFCRHFHIPLQSGSDTILRAMRRRYTAPYYAGLIERIRAAMPDAGIGIDVICGFPGETDELFAETVEFLEKLPFSYLHVFRYSERANTAATAFADPVPERVRKQRTTILRELSARKHHEFLQAQVGTDAVVIVEKPDPETGLQYGYASNYARVCVGKGEYSVNSTVHMHLSGVGDEVMQGVVLRVETPTAHSEYFPLPVMS